MPKSLRKLCLWKLHTRRILLANNIFLLVALILIGVLYVRCIFYMSFRRFNYYYSHHFRSFYSKFKPRIPQVISIHMTSGVPIHTSGLRALFGSFLDFNYMQQWHRLLPAKRDAQLIGRLRSAKLQLVMHGQLVFLSFIPYSLANFQ